MLPSLAPTTNLYGSDVSALVPDDARPVGLRPADEAVWAQAAEYLAVRSNDAHTIYSYGISRALVGICSEAEPDVVLPAILLHDIGWSQVDPELVLSAIAPGSYRPGLVFLHEKEGARLARAILVELGHESSRVDEIIDIIDGHDSRREALSLNDALVKDADKLWRLTPHGVETVMDWFGLSRDEARRLIESRVHDHLLTDPARSMARVLAAVCEVDSSPQRVALS